MISVEQLLFCYFATAIVVSGALAVTLRNPVHSVLLVLVLFFHMAGIYLTLSAEFLAAVQMVVYAGAVLVLYLFVLFLINLKDEIRPDRNFIRIKPRWAVISIVVLVSLLLAVRSFSLWQTEDAAGTTAWVGASTKALGLELFRNYLLPFEITGIILLVAVVGGMVLARREDSPDAKGSELPTESCARRTS